MKQNLIHAFLYLEKRDNAILLFCSLLLQRFALYQIYYFLLIRVSFSNILFVNFFKSVKNNTCYQLIACQFILWHNRFPQEMQHLANT